MRQVVADHVLDDLASRFDDLAGREHRFEPQDVLFRRAVLEGARAAGTLRDVTANRRQPQRRWVRGIEEPDALHGVLEVTRDDIRLDYRQEVDLIDFENAVHALEREHHTATHRAPIHRCSRCRRHGGRSARDAPRTRARPPPRRGSYRERPRRRQDGRASARQYRRSVDWRRPYGRWQDRRPLRAPRERRNRARSA